MRRVFQVVCLVFFGFALFYGYESSKMVYYDRLGPGPGFFPIWLAGAFGLLSLVLFFQVSKFPDKPLPEGLVPAREGALRVGAVLVALMVFAFTLNVIGFRLAMLLMLGSLMFALGRQRFLINVSVALLGSFGLYHVFTSWLGVPLPNASLPWLHLLNL